MDIREIEKNIKQINNYTTTNKLLKAFDLIDFLIEQNNLNTLKEQKNKLLNIYKNILKYSFIGIEDPERDKVYFNLKKSIIKTSNEIKYKLILANKHCVT